MTLTLFLLALPTVTSAAETQVHELTGGNWFDGEGFVERTVYSVDGVQGCLPADLVKVVQPPLSSDGLQ